MSGSWLLVPVLFPIAGGLLAACIHTLQVRRAVVSAILVVELLLLLPAAGADTGPFVLLELAPGARIVLQADALGRMFAVLIALIWFAVAFFAFEYMNHEGHRSGSSGSTS